MMVEKSPALQQAENPEFVKVVEQAVANPKLLEDEVSYLRLLKAKDSKFTKVLCAVAGPHGRTFWRYAAEAMLAEEGAVKFEGTAPKSATSRDVTALLVKLGHWNERLRGDEV